MDSGECAAAPADRPGLLRCTISLPAGAGVQLRQFAQLLGTSLLPKTWLPT
jgi:hypothetical protein